jgi:hypothetical protein
LKRKRQSSLPCNESFLLIPRELKGPVGAGFSFDPKSIGNSEVIEMTHTLRKVNPTARRGFG